MAIDRILATLTRLIFGCLLTASSLAAQEYYDLEEAMSNPGDVVKLILSETSLDPNWSQFNRLEYLNLLECQIDSLNHEIERLSNLRVIEIRSSGLKYISPKINLLSELTTLTLSGNQLSRFPNLRGLDNLKVVDLSGNQITRIPRRKDLPPNLKSLILIGNPIKRIPCRAKKIPGLEL